MPERADFGLCSGSCSPPAPEAAPAPVETPAPATAKKTERIEVTGSRIKRIDVEGSTSVTVFDKSRIERSGAANLGELLGKSTSSPTGNFSGGDLNVRGGAATVDLLGIGANRTLVLLNGKRLPVESSLGAVNVANIPVAIIERVEVLAGGASAIYGTDAVGGVLNIILKKDYQGVEATTQVQVPQHGGGEVFEVNAIGGSELGSATNAFVYGGYRRTREIIDTNRDKIKSNRPGREYTAVGHPPGTYSYRVLKDYGTADEAPGDYRPSANCPIGNQVATVPSLPNDIYCAGLRSERATWLTPAGEEYFLVGRLQHDLTSNTRVGATAIYNAKRSHLNAGNYLVATGDPITDQGILMSQARAESLGITGLENDDVVELFANTFEMKDRVNKNKDSLVGGILELESQLNDVDVQVNASHFVARNQRTYEAVLNKEREIALLHPRVNPLDPAFIPIDPNRNQALLGGIYDDLQSREKTETSFVEATASKDLFELPAGKVQGLFGVSVTTESYEQSPDKRDQLFYRETLGQPEAADGSNVVAIQPLYEGTTAVSGKGSRSVSSLFTELVVPVVAGAEITGALRYDNYSDVGNTTNYGLGAKYKVAEFLMLRGHTDSSFKAPQLSFLHNEGGGGYISIVDDKWCEREVARGNVCELGTSHQIYVDSPGNPDLKEEKGKSYTLGFVLEPLPQLTITSDYYSIRLNGTHNTDDGQDVVDRYYGAQSVGENQVSADSDGVISTLRLPYQNSGETMVNALDTHLHYDRNLGLVKLGYDAGYFRYISYKVRDYTDSPNLQKVGYKGLPLWTMTNSLSFGLPQDQTVTVSSQTIGKQQTDPKDVKPGQAYRNVDQYSEFDATYGLALPWNGDLLVGINNVLDTIGGRDDSGSPIGEESVDQNMYSVRGRTFFAKLSQRF